MKTYVSPELQIIQSVCLNDIVTASSPTPFQYEKEGKGFYDEMFF